MKILKIIQLSTRQTEIWIMNYGQEIMSILVTNLKEPNTCTFKDEYKPRPAQIIRKVHFDGQN